MTDLPISHYSAIPAEQSIIGAALCWPDCVDAIRLTPEDFANLGHATTWRTIRAMLDAGQGVDTLTVAETLERAGKLESVGGLAYLAEMAQAVMSPANVRQYATMVKDASVRRGLLAALQSIGEAAQHGNISDVLADAQARIMAIGERSDARVPVRVVDIARDRLNVLDERFNGNDDGISTGLTDLDEKLGKIRAGDLMVIAGRPGMGKAQPLDAKLLRDDGTWVSMGDVRVGDQLASIDAGGATVSCIHPRGERQVFRVTLSDGRSTECCADHLWTVVYRDWDAPRTIDTQKLVEMLSRKRYQGRLSIGMVSGDFGKSTVPLDPYVLGVLLGDGNFSGSGVRLTSADDEIVSRVSERLGETVEVKRVVGSYAHSLSSKYAAGRGKETVLRNGVPYYERNIYPVIDALESLGLRGLTGESKFIPEAYLSSDRESRLELLRGLLDTDGWAEVHGSIGFSSCSKLLAIGVQSLVRSLGGICHIKEKQTSFTSNGEKKAGRTAYLCRIRHLHGDELFSLERKSARAVRTKNGIRLTIKSIEPSRVCDTQCITVNRDDGLYVTDDYIVTHNSAFSMQLAETMATERKPALFFSLEMSAGQLVDRLLSSAGRVNLKKFRSADFAPDDWEGLTAAVGQVQGMPVFIDDHSHTLADILATMRSFKRRMGGLGPVVVDYIGLVDSPGDTREQEIAKITRSLKLAAKQLQCPIMALSQLNRKLEDRADRRPQQADLRESGAVEQDADSIVMLYRDEIYNPDSQHKGICELLIRKNRHGETGMVPVVFRAELVRFENFAGQFVPASDYKPMRRKTRDDL